MTNTRKILMGASALAGALSIALMATGANAETKAITFDLPSQPLGESLRDFYRESGEQIVFSEDLVAGRTSPALKGSYTADQALAMLLEGTTLTARRTSTGVVMIEAPQSGSAAGDGADQGTVQALIVTAQKREEQIQDVPIAISAFTEKSLQEQKIEGGFDLLKAIPNVTFSKNNFTSYNFSIRGVGTKAVSATTDPGVAVSFNNVALIQNRLFEQEYFDIERVEVLRGPQGTLYGRNATSGVINVIPKKPDLSAFDGWVKGEVGNYHTKRVSAMVNVPLIDDKLAIRVAGSLTDRAGYDYNSVTQHAINGRDLWSGRLSIGFQPTERVHADLVWERFNEDDDRSRTGKQLCKRDAGPTIIGSTPVVPGASDPITQAYHDAFRPALFSQGCAPTSLYDQSAFGTPNGLALPFVFGLLWVSTPCGPSCAASYPIGFFPGSGNPASLLQLRDPYGGMMQSPDLRTIASFRDPVYRAKADLLNLNVDFDLTDNLTFTSQTVYNQDSVYSFQDYNRFNTQPVFTDTSSLTRQRTTTNNPTGGGPSVFADLARGGIFCDPQLGCSDTLAGFDISQGEGKQFSQEFRLQSDFEGPINFSVGANYTRFSTLIDYYVFYNLITAMAVTRPFNTTGTYDTCNFGTTDGVSPDVPGPLPISDPRVICPYVDPQPLHVGQNFQGDGHNYFRSKNPYKLKSAAAFGELYWKITGDLKMTAGLRYTDDRKTFIPVPSQLLLAKGPFAGGLVSQGYPEDPAIKQHWGEWTGRFGFDWKPKLSFTDQTLLYAFYSRGYKGGGANPPSPGFSPDALVLTAVEYGRTFEPEFVNAYEVGAKNTLFNGAMTLNTDAFFYDYKDYQVSQIRDRTAVNENFDAKIWGLEFETLFAPTENLRFNANLGYLDTAIANGESSIDIMNRTQGDPNYVLMKPWAQLPSNCVAPVSVVEHWMNYTSSPQQQALLGYISICGGVTGGIISLLGRTIIDPNPAFNGGTGVYDVSNYPEINGGAGIRAQLGGNELPNAPHWTMNLGAQYGHGILDGSWKATVRADAYWQSQSWARVYNAVNDKLHGWYNVNLSVWFERPEDDLKIELYAKNLLDKTPITDAFLNSDDSGLTTNVFVLDPRLIGLSIRKGF